MRCELCRQPSTWPNWNVEDFVPVTRHVRRRSLHHTLHADPFITWPRHTHHARPNCKRGGSSIIIIKVSDDYIGTYPRWIDGDEHCISIMFYVPITRVLYTQDVVGAGAISQVLRKSEAHADYYDHCIYVEFERSVRAVFYRIIMLWVYNITNNIPFVDLHYSVRDRKSASFVLRRD